MAKLFLPNLLLLYGFVAVGIPLSRLEIGSMPLYFIDIIAALVVFMGRNHIARIYRRHRRLSTIILVFIFTLLPTTFSELLRMSPLEPIYLLCRTLLHIIAVWSLSGFLRNEQYLKKFFTGLACGVLFTATIASMNSLPITGPWVRAHIFTIDWLKPQRGDYEVDAEILMKYDKGEAERGDSLLGKSNITGTVLITMLPFLIGAVRNIRLKATAKLIFNAAIIISFFAMLFTYSRAAYLAIAILLFGYLLFERQAFSKRFLPLIILAGVIIGAVGVQSTVFKFEFIANKFDLSNEKYTYTNQARVYAYTVPFQVIYNNPSYLFRGAGRADKKLREKNSEATILELYNAEMHSVFAASIFYRGFLSMLAIFYLYYRLTKTSYDAIKRSKRENNPAQWMAIASVISLMSLLPGWGTDHYIVTKMSMHMHMFLIVALVFTSLEHIKLNSENTGEKTKNKPVKEYKRILHKASGRR